LSRRFKTITRRQVTWAGLVLAALILGGLTLSGCGVVGPPSRGFSAVTLGDNTLLVGAKQGSNAVLVAFNATDYSTLWPAQTEGGVPGLLFRAPASSGFILNCATPPQESLYGTPAVSGTTVYVAAYSGKVYAYDYAAGRPEQPLWQYPAADQTYLRKVVSSPVLWGGLLYFGSADGKLYALDAATGELKWSFQTGDMVWGTPTVDGTTIYFGSFDKKLYALDAVSGEKKWEFQADGALMAQPVVFGGAVYVGDYGRQFYAVNAADGTEKWRFQAEKGFWARAVVAGNTVYAPNLDYSVYALNAASGQMLAQLDLGSQISSSPVMVGDQMYVVPEKGTVYAIDTAKNTKRIVFTDIADKSENVYAPLTAVGNIIYIHAQTNSGDNYYAYDTQSKTMRPFSAK
jgi:outer membrane protein assembly factor BamB